MLIGSIYGKSGICMGSPRERYIWPVLRLKLRPATAGILEQHHLRLYLMVSCQDHHLRIQRKLLPAVRRRHQAQAQHLASQLQNKQA